MSSNNKQQDKPQISLFEAITILVILFCVLGYLIIAQQISPQVPILVVLTLLMFYGKFRGFSWDDVMEGIEEGIKPGITPLMIFLMIGALIACWIYSGTIPTIMYFGFNLISAQFFLPTIFIVCSLVAIICGSSFTTISTIGIAFMGIGTVLHINPALTVGAIVSGAFFGANVSPLSGTTNLAAGIGGIDLYDHIKSLLFTDMPAFLIVLFMYFVCGLGTKNVQLTAVAKMMTQIQQHFWISFWAILPIILLLVLAWMKVPAVPSLIAGSALGVLVGFIHNPHTSLATIADYIMNGYVTHTHNKMLDTLFSKGGISSMLSSAALIILALALGGLLIKFDIIGTIINHLSATVNRPGSLICLTALSCIGVNFLVGEQYLSIILPGQAFETSYLKQNLPHQYLTRTLNDAGAAVNAIVPWGVSGTFIAGALQIDAMKYIPYAFFPLLVPVITIIIGFFMKKRQLETV
ncbi:Na+/H+ antiporter NhaC [Ligilactobacillus cholophilus]|uniref:Na+/H+ antiporter NhaC n=1 Tax=Ligilactobacillus cholophilus TaxID=3050131 RepID=UPI0025B1971C|nr:Na+/H+ antiporter NhaC [Ligilactobacillus cholophilus]